MADIKGTACSNSRPQPGAKKFGGLEEVGGSGGLASQPPGPHGGGGGTPTHIPQNDPHDALIILDIHNWGKKLFRKILPISSGSHQPTSEPEVRSWVKIVLCFPPIFEFSTNF